VAEGIENGESFTDFLDAAALVSDADSFEGKPGITLITLHSTKGLEFDHVFLTGMEEGISPHSRALNEEKGIEEERRLVYVGMTRARKSLTLTRAVYRAFSEMSSNYELRFLSQIPYGGNFPMRNSLTVRARCRDRARRWAATKRRTRSICCPRRIASRTCGRSVGPPRRENSSAGVECGPSVDVGADSPIRLLGQKFRLEFPQGIGRKRSS